MTDAKGLRDCVGNHDELPEVMPYQRMCGACGFVRGENYVKQSVHTALAERLKEMTESKVRCWNEWTLAEQNVKSLEAERDQLKERLKACEEDKAWFEEFACSCNVPDYICQAHSERDETNTTLFKDRLVALTADLEELKLRLKMEAECHEQTVADLQRARAEVDDCRNTLKDERYCHGQTIDSLKRISSQMLAETRHDRDTMKQSNERLKAVLINMIAWVEPHRLPPSEVPACVLDAQAALTETP